jgi:hypothetical protein
VTQCSKATCRSIICSILSACGPLCFCLAAAGPGFKRVGSSCPANCLWPSLLPRVGAATFFESMLCSAFADCWARSLWPMSVCRCVLVSCTSILIFHWTVGFSLPGNLVFSVRLLSFPLIFCYRRERPKVRSPVSVGLPMARPLVLFLSASRSAGGRGDLCDRHVHSRVVVSTGGVVGR